MMKAFPKRNTFSQYLNVLYQMMRADLLERTRRYSFLITLGLMIFLAYAYVPSRQASYITLSVDGARGLYNSAWVGTLVAILAGMTLPFLGFYLVKNAIARDKETGVGQIIATTPLRRPQYTLGKWLSNFVVLALMVGVTTLAAGVWQLALGESRQIHVFALVEPLLWVVLPSMAFVGALAVLFESVGWLSGTLGNMVYFFVSTAVTMASFMPVMISEGGSVSSSPVDIFGVSMPLAKMLNATEMAFPDLDHGNNSIGPIPTSLAGPLQTFEWEGMEWTLPVIKGRLVWVGVAIFVALLASLFFTRFDPARERRRRQVDSKSPEVANESKSLEAAPVAVSASNSVGTVYLSSISPAKHSFINLLLAELRLMGKSLRWWWYLVALVLGISGLFVSTEFARRTLLPLTWLWPILIWSSLGSREARNRTGQLIFSAVRPLSRQLLVTWVEGLLITALTGVGVAINYMVNGEFIGLLVWAFAVLFIPTLALAAGIWTGSGKLFEVTYLSLWYFGPFNKILPQLDFMGASDEALAAGIPWLFLLVTLALIGCVVVGRVWQIRK